MSTKDRLNEAIRIAEGAGDAKLAFRLQQAGRSISAAQQTEIDLESWDSFYTWWNNNRSEQLLFSITDTLGEQNPAVAHLKEVLQKQNELDKQLHNIYLGLKGEGEGQGGEEPEGEPEPEPEKPAEELEEIEEDIEEKKD